MCTLTMIDTGKLWQKLWSVFAVSFNKWKKFMLNCMVCVLSPVWSQHDAIKSYVEIEGYEKVNARTHVSFSVADTMEWFRQLKMLLFQE